jgi:hypothetical protein
MKKRTVLIGINEYQDSRNNLRGCVNDIMGMWDLLTNQYKFDPEYIRVLTDQRALQQNIIDRMTKSIMTAKPGDCVVWHYSGHGSQVRDKSGDELKDGLDEILCPHDMDWDNPLTDDTIGAIIGCAKPGVKLIFICDSCHSGSITKELHANERYLKPPADIRLRSVGRKLFQHTMASKIGAVDWVLLSGCQDNESSAEGEFDNELQGVMTSAFLQVSIDTSLTWKEAHRKTVKLIHSWGYQQTPVLSGTMINNKLFT